VEVLSSTDSADPVAEVRRLRRQLRRERALRQAAETMGERANAELYASVRELRSAQVELLERADQTRVVNELARALRQDLDSAALVNRAAESVGRATSVDRCDVLLVDAHRYSAVQGTWSSSPETAKLPRPHSFVELPETLTPLLLETAQHLATLRIDDVETDSRLGPTGARDIVAALGVHALAAVPIAFGDEVVGWLLLQSVRPRVWQSREITICEGLSHDLVSSLIQVQSFEQQRQSVKRLEELDRAKDAFISTVSHELRTPLTSIVGYVEMLVEGGLGPVEDGVSAGLKIIERNATRLQVLVDDLLALSAYDAAQVHLDLQPTDLAEVVDDCVEALRPGIEAKLLRVTVAPGPVLALVDRTQVERVVLNLLSNALKFSHEAGAVHVALREEDDEVVMEFHDRGIGIPEAEQDRLFSRFYRSSLSTSGEIQGTGLGLALVKSVVDRHGGSVRLHSIEGAGTSVTVRLPRSR
jgi:two-component system phosphate regulon sensor histidine kinase PhoR